MAATKKTLTTKIGEMLDAMIEDGWNQNVFGSYDEWADWITDQVEALARQKAQEAAGQQQQPVAPKQKAAPAFRRAGPKTAAQKKAAADKSKATREALVNKGNPPRRK